MYYTKPYKAWANMLNRVRNPNTTGFDNYGGRGISVDKRWSRFTVFWTDMGRTYKDGLTLERVDVNGDYCKENCTWTTVKQQQRNRRSNTRLTYKNSTRVISEWAEHTGISHATISKRINLLGWGVERALTTIPRGSKVLKP